MLKKKKIAEPIMRSTAVLWLPRYFGYRGTCLLVTDFFKNY